MRFIFLLFLVSSITWANRDADSLFNALSDQPEVLRIKALNEYCWKNRSSNPVDAIIAGEMALGLTRKINNRELEARTLNLLGVVTRSIGNSNKSLNYLRDALNVAIESNNQTEIAYSENNIGGAYRMKAYFTLAFQHVSKALRIFESLQDSSGMSYALINIGFIYQGQKNYEKAQEYFNKTLQLRERIKDSLGVLVVLCEIARVDKEMGNFKSAIQKFKNVEDQSRRLNDKAGITRAYFGLGEIYLKMKNFQLAAEYESMALQMALETGNTYNIIRSGENLGIALAQLGNHTEAEKIVKRSLALAQPFNDYSLLAGSYSALKQVYELKGDYKLALHYSNLYTELQDSITAKDNISSVSEMEAIFQNERVKRDNEELHRNFELAETQRTYLAIIVGLFVALTVTFYWRYRSERRAHKVEERLRKSEEKFKQIFTNSYMGIFHAAPTGVFLQVNPALASLFGFITPEDFLSVYPSFQSLPFVESIDLAELFNPGKTKEWNAKEHRFSTPHSDELIALIHLRKEIGSDNGLLYFEGIIENITDRKNVEAAKEQYSLNLRNLNAAKDKFFSIISHDLRGPYQGFLGITQLLAENPESFNQSKIKEIGADLYRAAENQYQLLNDLLSWSKMQTGDFTLELNTLNLHREVELITRQFELTAKKKRITIQNLIPHDIEFIADISMLHLLIRNLVSNSIKFTYPNGFVTIEAQASGDFIEILVNDNGVGIEPENIEKLFRIDRKHSTEGTAQESGSGLGLTLCNEIVQKHSGYITVDSMINRGTRITIKLPARPFPKA